MKDIQYVGGLLKAGFEEPKWNKVKHVISASQIGNYRKCPKLWELASMKKLSEFEQNIYLVYGNAMHLVVQKWLHTMYTISGKEASKMNLKEMLLNAIKDEYSKALEQTNGEHFSSKEELIQFYGYGCAVLDFLTKKRADYFKLRGFELLGIELPIWTSPSEDIENVKFVGYIDVLLYDKKYDEYHVMDIKTSTKGWNKWKKKDKLTTDQILFYKIFLNEQYGIPIDKIKVQYFILKSIINEDSIWPSKRIQQFSPADGSISCNRVKKAIEEFIDNCFLPNGEYNEEGNYPAVSGKNGWNCTFCDFKDRHDLCPPENRKECI